MQTHFIIKIIHFCYCMHDAGGNMEFINKVYIRKKSRTAKQILSMIGSIICFLILVITVALGGDRTIDFSILAMFIFLLGNAMTGTNKGKYISVVSELEMTDEKMLLTYVSIDREDGIGKRNEVMEFRTEEISNIYYSDELNSIKIEGNGIREIQCLEKKGNKKKKRSDYISEVYIYLDEVDKGTLIGRLKEITGKEIQYVK